MDVREHYRDAVTHALGGFQLLEESLKVYLNLYYKSVRHLLGKKLHFSHERRDIEEAPLGRLVTMFSKACANGELLDRLRSLIRHRDHAAHKAYLRLYGEDTSEDEFHTHVREIHELREEVRDVLKQVQAEIHEMQQSIFGGFP